MAAAAILGNFEWPHLRNGSRSTYIARDARAVIFAIAQLSCSMLHLLHRLYGVDAPGATSADVDDERSCRRAPTSEMC